MDPLISTTELARQIDDPRLRLVDVRWYLDPRRKGRDEYVAGHLPGALFMDIEQDLAAPGGGRGLPVGRHPWPAPEQVARVMGAAGIGPGVRVVAYDDQAGATAARLWFVLRTHGHADVVVLDGGLPKWLAEGRALVRDVPAVTPVVFTPRFEATRVLDTAAVQARVPGTLVLDARALERYRGQVEPIDPRAGHVPGARSAPFSDNLTHDALPIFKPAAELRARYAALGADQQEAIVYCGSGVTACHDLLALEVAGLRGRLYAGSWSAWSSDPRLPVASVDE